MNENMPVRLALGGLLAMAAAMGIGRFVYTPILPAMISALEWSKIDAGLVASANFLGYLIGAIAVGHTVFTANPRAWLFLALAVSTTTTAAMGLTGDLYILITMRFAGGVASAFVIICGSTLVLERLAIAGKSQLSSVHFAGVGVGIVGSAVIAALVNAMTWGWQSMWWASGLAALVASLLVARLIPATGRASARVRSVELGKPSPALAWIAVAHGLFGFGYVITATFIVTIVRDAPAIRHLEPWIWIVVGVASIPSVPIWQWLGRRIGLARAYSVACLVEAISVAASVEWISISGVFVSAMLLGGTFMGLTALGLMCAREFSGGRPQRALGLTTATFGLGQMIGPTVAGVLSQATGNLRAASLAAAAALLVAAALAYIASYRSG